MARRHSPALGATASEDAEETGSTMEGGSPGVAPGDLSEVRMPGAVTARANLGSVPAEPIARYRAVNGGHVMYGGCRTVIRAGKLVDAYSYDLDLLRRQGIVLEEVKS